MSAPARRRRLRHLRPGIRQHGEHRERHHLHRRRQRDAVAPWLPDRRPRRAMRLPRGGVSPSLRRAPRHGRPRGVAGQGPAPHPAQRGAQAVLRRLPPQRPPHGDPVLRHQRHLHLLRAVLQPEGPGSGPGERHPADRQDADGGRLGVQEVDRPAVRLPAQRSELRGELPPHDVRPPGGGGEDRPDHRQGTQRAAHPPRRSRAELLNGDGALRRLQPGEPVRLRGCRDERPVGPAPRRRQPGGRRDAGRHPRRPRHDGGEGDRPGQGQGRPLPADGLRSPHLPQLRPAGRRS